MNTHNVPKMILAAVLLLQGTSWAAPDPMEASIRAKADRPWFAQFMVGEPVVAGFPGESEEDREKRTQPWRDAKFGLFLHWGPQRSGGEYVIMKGWIDPSDWAEWELLADKSGVYKLKVSYSSWMESGKFAVEIDGQRFEHTVVASKHKGKRSPLVAAFKTVSLGNVRLKKPGSHTLVVKAVEITPEAIVYHHGLMLLREVILKKQ